MRWFELRNKSDNDIKAWLLSHEDDRDPHSVVLLTALITVFDRIEDLQAEIDHLKRQKNPPHSSKG